MYAIRSITIRKAEIGTAEFRIEDRASTVGTHCISNGSLVWDQSRLVHPSSGIPHHSSSQLSAVLHLLTSSKPVYLPACRI